MKKYLPYIVISVSILLLFTLWYYWRHPLASKVTIHNHTITIELALTRQEKERGLGNRDRLADDTGMLFVYDHEEQYPFWMKDMRFPLDFIWIKGKTVVDITKDVPVSQDDTLPEYRPKIPVDKILEVNAGTVDRLGIVDGDEVKFITD